jgi:hypothetical protein
MTDDRRPDQSPALGHPQRVPDRKRPGRAVLQSFSIIARPGPDRLSMRRSSSSARRAARVCPLCGVIVASDGSVLG